MPTDDELRGLFRDSAAPAATIDVAAVIRRSKRRRLPQQLAVGGVTTLAVAGIGVAGFTGLRGLSPMQTADVAGESPAGMSEAAPFGGVDSRDEGADACPPVTVSVAPALVGVDSVVQLPESASLGQELIGTVTLHNSGAQPVSGVAVSPVLTLATGGESVWVGAGGASGAVPVELGPGESTVIDITFSALGCEPDSTAATLAPGHYEASVSLELLLDGSTRSVSSDAAPITIH